MVASYPRQDHVGIRDVQDSDLAAFFEHQLDPQATQMAAFPARDRDAFMGHWETIRADKSVLAQTIVVDGQVAGNIVSWEQEGHDEVGYWVGRYFWGHGVATRALTLFLAKVMQRPLYAYAAAGNIGSMKVLAQCGFRRAGAQEAVSFTNQDSAVAHIAFVLDAERAPLRAAACTQPWSRSS